MTSNKRGGRGGRGEAAAGGRVAGGASSGGPDLQPQAKRGAGRGNPDFKENRGGRVPGSQAALGPDGEGNGEASETRKFDAVAAQEWMTQRFQEVHDEYLKQKDSKEPGKKGDVQHFQDLNSEKSVSAWGQAKPVLPGKEDFHALLQKALDAHRPRPTDDEQNGAS